MDRTWHVPHFEKMLYDQAQLISAYTDLYLIEKSEWCKDVVKSTIAYATSNLKHIDGGFFCGEDADSLPLATSLEKVGNIKR